MGSLSKALEYLSYYLPSTFQYLQKCIEDTDWLSFLCSVIQVFLEFWNSSDPFEEYISDFTKTSRCVQDECAHMLTEIVSLLKQIRSYQYLLNIITVEKIDKLQKINTDLMYILDKYFSTNIWTN